LRIEPNQNSTLDFNSSYYLAVNTPITAIDTAQMKMIVKDSLPLSFNVGFDSVANKLDFDFEIEPNESYSLDLLPGAITDFFGQTNDTTNYRFSTRSFEDFGNLRLNLAGAIEYPVILQLIDENGKTKQEIYATEAKTFEFNNIDPATYFIRVIFDTNENKIWDTGNFLKSLQPERIIYYPDKIEVRANWELEQTFTISK